METDQVTRSALDWPTAPEDRGERWQLYQVSSHSDRRGRISVFSLKAQGFGDSEKVFSNGRNRAVIIHTATGDHLRDLGALFLDVMGASDKAR